MYALYEFLTGPMVWLTFIIFFGGCAYRLYEIIKLTYEKERFIFSYLSLKHSLNSILHWLTPFATVNMRRHPIMTVVTFLFHISLIVTPIFLLSHIVLWDEAWNISWPALPDQLADFMTLIVILACVFFLARRIYLPEVRYVTTPSDYVILSIVALPFITGFYAYHQWSGHAYAVMLHIISGHAMLIAIPFTRLRHMIFSIFTRAYTGSEFGSIRNVKDW